MSYTSLVMIIIFNVLTNYGIDALHVRILYLLCKLSSLIFTFVIIGILYVPPSYISSMTNSLMRKYVTSSMRHVRTTVDNGDF